MKTAAAWAVLLWMGIVLENSRTDLFSSCSLLVPLAVGCLFWLRNSSAIFLAGTAMIIRWLLQPSIPPVEVIVVLLISTRLIFRSPLAVAASNFKRSRKWIAPVCMSLLGVGAHAFVLASFEPAVAIEDFALKSLVVIPAIGVILLAGRVADELGLRQIAT